MIEQLRLVRSLRSFQPTVHILELLSVAGNALLQCFDLEALGLDVSLERVFLVVHGARGYVKLILQVHGALLAICDLTLDGR